MVRWQASWLSHIIEKLCKTKWKFSYLFQCKKYFSDERTNNVPLSNHRWILQIDKCIVLVTAVTGQRAHLSRKTEQWFLVFTNLQNVNNKEIETFKPVAFRGKLTGHRWNHQFQQCNRTPKFFSTSSASGSFSSRFPSRISIRQFLWILNLQPVWT